MISQERFNKIESEHGCGYWFECCDHACPCAITTENKGLKQNIWNEFKKEQEELIEEYDRERFDDNYGDNLDSYEDDDDLDYYDDEEY